MAEQTTSTLINQMYGQSSNGNEKTTNEKISLWDKILRYIRKSSRIFSSMNREQYRQFRLGLIISMVVLTIVIIDGIYYYNKFIFQISNILSSASKVETILERKRNLSVNLSKIVTDYALYEERVFGEVANARQIFAIGKTQDRTGQFPLTKTNSNSITAPASAAATAPKYSTGELLSKLFALSEQYPDLKVHQNLLKFIDALVESEKALSDARAEYNSFVNVYRASVKMFPGNFYNLFFNFKLYPFFEASDEVRQFWKVPY
ncbi:MAG: LemA family protein [Oligoflexia bacterium]|nr:LemA family protein [Oligoflexia bacterium]